MKKGFTLVELLGILMILGVITLIAAPAIVSTNKKSIDNDYVEFKKTIENAAEVYVETHLDDIDVINLKNNGSSMDIDVSTLISSGLINGGMKNPNVKQDVNGNEKIANQQISVTASKEGNVIKYTYSGP
ncbi:MAG: hypothetical protein IKF01_01260 [Bacilli bacterium]|nr:hypothetical protein [Bacilli bacterium]